jgi:predicted house-cleaning noncanonical NTP pyrophosphatase (MazG superfamily)
MKKTKPLKNLILEHDLDDEEFWDDFFDKLNEEVLDYEDDESNSDPTTGSV